MLLSRDCGCRVLGHVFFVISRSLPSTSQSMLTWRNTPQTRMATTTCLLCSSPLLLQVLTVLIFCGFLAIFIHTESTHFQMALKSTCDVWHLMAPQVVVESRAGWLVKFKIGESHDKFLMGNPMIVLQGVAYHMGSHNVSCHPTQVNTPRLKPSTPKLQTTTLKPKL